MTTSFLKTVSKYHLLPRLDWPVGQISHKWHHYIGITTFLDVLSARLEVWLRTSRLSARPHRAALDTCCPKIGKKRVTPHPPNQLCSSSSSSTLAPQHLSVAPHSAYRNRATCGCAAAVQPTTTFLEYQHPVLRIAG